MPDMFVLSVGTAFKMPASFSSKDTPYSKLSTLQNPKWIYDVADILICVALSDIIKNHSDPTVFTFEKLKEDKDFSFDQTAVEKSDMRMVDPASFFLQTCYDDFEWTNTELKKGIQSLIFHGGNVVMEMFGNLQTFDKKMSELFLHGLPVPEVPEEEAEGVAEGELPQEVAIDEEAALGEDAQQMD